MKKYIHTYYVSLLAYILPATSFAALDGIKGLLTEVKGILKLIIPIVFGLAMVYFFWGIVQFIRKDAGNDKTREEGKQKIIWGVVALFIMFSILGILKTIGGLTGITTTLGN